MNNFVLITSIINTPHTPLSYSKIRSVFTRPERFEQTKQTINSIKEYIPNCKIILVECTDFSVEESTYFKENCDYIINLISDYRASRYIFSCAKAAGEGTMTNYALQYIIKNDIKFDNLFKISGRYYLKSDFKYSLYNNKNNIFKKIDHTSLCTAFYKVNYESCEYLLQFILSNFNRMINAEGYEAIFNDIQQNVVIYKDLQFVDNLGIYGNISVCGGLLIS
jgi:hypothetical protein